MAVIVRAMQGLVRTPHGQVEREIDGELGNKGEQYGYLCVHDRLTAID